MVCQEIVHFKSQTKQTLFVFERYYMHMSKSPPRSNAKEIIGVVFRKKSFQTNWERYLIHEQQTNRTGGTVKHFTSASQTD